MGVAPAQLETVANGSTPRQQERGSTERRDIQGLRALAVGLVVVYHLRPDWLSGGFVGVDVFFVISGFLIIGTQTGEVRRTGKLRLLDFYARRIRRLLPAASVVLLGTIATTIAVLPISLWPEILREVAASSLDIQNWALAVQSTNYAAAGAGASPVQHFWSLSVEEQFYLVIPLVLLICARLIGKRRPVRTAFIGVAVLTLASLVFSIYYTPIAHGPAYFVTPTRMWELGLGGLAAMVVPRLRIPRLTRVALGWLGLVAIGISAVIFTTDLDFPGWIALLPTLGALGLLLAGVLPAGERPVVLETAQLLGLQPLRYLGDISYSLYLWHWPIIVFALDLTGVDRLDRYQALAVLVLSLALASASKHFIEDPFRHRRAGKAAGQPAARPRRRTAYVLGASLIAVTLVAASVPWHLAQTRLDTLAEKTALSRDTPGALALSPTDPSPVPGGVAVVPNPAVAGQDYYLQDRPNCAIYDYLHHSIADGTCAYGSTLAPKTIVLVGDSHAAQFSTSLADYVQRNGDYRLKVMMRNGCPFNTVPPYSGSAPLTPCSDQDKAELAQIIAAKPALVVTEAMAPVSYRKDLDWTWPSTQQQINGYRDVLSQLSAAGIPTAVIRDVPRPAANVPTCLQRNPQQYSACDTPLADALLPDPLAQAARSVPGVQVVDLTQWLCTGQNCPAVVGNVVVYRDSHLTNTYAHTLSIPLANALNLP